MLDIALIIPELTKYGGAERFLIECLAQWQDRHKITLYSSKFNYSLLAEHRIKKKVSLVQIAPYFKEQYSLVLDGVLLPKIWEHQIGEHDIYHAHLWPTHLIDLHPMVWFPHEPLRIIHDLRYNEAVNISPKDSIRPLHVYPKYSYDDVADLTREASLNAITSFDLLGKPDRIVANSRYTAAYLQEVYGLKTIDVVYPGVNVDDFITMPLADQTESQALEPPVIAQPEEPDAPLVARSVAEVMTGRKVTAPADQNVLLTIGQLWPHKRIDRIIEAVKLVENVQLYIVGSGPEEQRLKTITNYLGLADRVFFLHDLTHLELRILFARSLAFIFAAIREPFGIVALEAMAAGKPLIAVDEGGFTEVVDDSCAMLVNPLPTAIAEKICCLRDNKDLARQMGLAGREKARQFTWDRTAEELLAIIEQTAGDWHAKRTALEPKKTEKRPLFGVQYYCWYGDGIGSVHWNDNPASGTVTDMPQMGHYCSSRRVTIEQHLDMMQKTGLDFAILNLHIDNYGLNRSELATIENIFNLAEKLRSPLSFAVQICVYDATKSYLLQALEVLRKICINRPNYLRFDAKPVLFVFWTGAFDGQRSWLKLLQDKTEDYLRIACSLRTYDRRNEANRTFGLFHSWCLYSPLEIADSSKWTTLWKQAYRNGSGTDAGPKVITVSPGYDDTSLQTPDRKRNPYRLIDREDGATYGKMIDFALSLDTPPDMVVVSTFNEFHENTHIEPSEKLGRKYLDMTREFIAAGRKTWKAK